MNSSDKSDDDLRFWMVGFNGMESCLLVLDWPPEAARYLESPLVIGLNRREGRFGHVVSFVRTESHLGQYKLRISSEEVTRWARETKGYDEIADWMRRSREAERGEGTYGRALSPERCASYRDAYKEAQRELEELRQRAILETLPQEARTATMIRTPHLPELWPVAWDGCNHTLLSANGPWEAAQYITPAVGMMRTFPSEEKTFVPDIAAELSQGTWYMVENSWPTEVEEVEDIPEPLADYYLRKGFKRRGANWQRQSF